jgi:probable HAF family extracellular repeat protein
MTMRRTFIYAVFASTTLLAACQDSEVAVEPRQHPSSRPSAVTVASVASRDIAPTGVFGSEATAINAAGHAAGHFFATKFSGQQIFFFDGTTTSEITGFTTPEAIAINANDQILVTDFGDGTGAIPASTWLVTSTTRLNIGTLGGAATKGLAMNDAGHIVGESQTASGALHAFLWDGTMHNLGVLGSDLESLAFRINNADQVAGWGPIGDAFHAHAFVYSGGALQAIGSLGGDFTQALGINDLGQVTGVSTLSDGAQRAFLWNGTTISDIGDAPAGGKNPVGRFINHAGQVAGSYNDAGGLISTFFFDGSTLRDIGNLGGQFPDRTRVRGLNDAGLVVGEAATVATGGGDFHAFLWDGTTLLDLAGTISRGDAVNESGQVAGFMLVNGQGDATVWTPTFATPGSASAAVWVGLKNSDDVGTMFDLRVEVLKNGSTIATGELDGVSGGSSGFNNAILRTINASLASAPTFGTGDQLGIRLSVRIAQGVPGHRSGTARLWYNDASANSSVAITLNNALQTYYLAGGFTLSASPGTGPRSTVDVTVDRLKNGNAFTPFGTWVLQF